MSGIGEFGASSFDSYEGIRIFIPGVIAFAAGYSAYQTVSPGQGASLTADTLLSFVASLVVGLILYFWDIPARSAAFMERQPTNYLEAQFPDIAPGVLLTAYLSILNTKMPANLRNRSLYMGSMYRIGVEMILALAIACSVVFGASLFDYGGKTGESGRLVRLLSAAALAVTFMVSLLINKGYERKNAARLRIAPGKGLAAVVDALKHRSMTIYVGGVVVLMLPNLTALASRLSFVWERGISAMGLAICTVYWVQRYVRGDRLEIKDPRKRKRLEAPAAGLLFVLPLILTLVTYPPGRSTILQSGAPVTGWTAAACLTLVSVMIRGHERKLHGSYAGQTRWLQDNAAEYQSIVPGPP